MMLCSIHRDFDCSNLTRDPDEGRGRGATKSPGAFPAFHLLHISPGGAPKPPKMRAAATYFFKDVMLSLVITLYGTTG